MKNNFLIVIATNHSSTLKQVLLSINMQSFSSYRVVVIGTKRNFNLRMICKKTIYIYSKIKNQVYQRSLAKKFINKNTNYVLFLDDKIVLEKNAIANLLNDWKKMPSNVAGIGMSCINYKKPKTSIFQTLTLTNSSKIGVVLPSGFVSGYDQVSKYTEVDWLNGGMSCWRSNLIIKKLNRNYPRISWSVGEDLIFSYSFHKIYKLVISPNAKCKILSLKKKENIKNFFIKGFFHSKIIKSFVLKNNKKLSIFLFYYSIYSSSILGIVKNIFKFDIYNSARFVGRFCGSFFKYKNIS